MGSILAGNREFIKEARRIKQRFGGGWRQAGVIAAPGIIGLKKMVNRLPEDHQNAENMRKGREGSGIMLIIIVVLQWIWLFVQYSIAGAYYNSLV
ncbi:MAG: hypothetical protein KAT88_03690 [Spirochaetes bacterium]|nr:hypothetical protein [Spirochaetota bacterium]